MFLKFNPAMWRLTSGFEQVAHSTQTGLGSTEASNHSVLGLTLIFFGGGNRLSRAHRKPTRVLKRLFNEGENRQGHEVDGSSDLGSFCRREYPRLVGVLSLYCGDRYIAEELAQEAIARVCRDWHKVQQLAAPGAWAHRVAINVANSYVRKKTAERRANQRLAAQGAESSDDPDTATAVALRQAVARLPKRQRTALVLRYYADLSVHEVADLMGCPDGTVKTLTAKAISNLRKEELIEPGGVPNAI